MTTPYVSHHLREPAVLVREAVGSFSDGAWVPGAVTRTNVEVVSSPLEMAGEWRDVIEPGDRLSDYREFFVFDPDTVSPIRVGSGQTGPDKIEYRGVTYLAKSDQDWTPHGYIRVLASRTEGQDSVYPRT